MLGRVILFIGVVLIIIAAVMLLWAYLSKRSQKAAVTTTSQARAITFRRTLCADVDRHIVSLELEGEGAPLPLLQARLAVDDAPNDETRAYALAALEEEFRIAKKRRN